MTKEKHSEIFKRINNIYEDLNDKKISYDKAEDEIVKLNNYYLSEFKKVLKLNKLSDRTINRTINSIDFFVNTYLCYRFDNTILLFVKLNGIQFFRLIAKKHPYSIEDGCFF